jgi:YbbR domain-containing protein
VDSDGQVVQGVSFSPESLTVYQTISQAVGYRDVAVKVVLVEGSQPAEGYRVSNISVTPLVVTIQAENPELVNQLPGYVETYPIDISGANDDIEIRVTLNLPEGITLLGDQTVVVQIGIAAYEGSLTVTLPVEADNLVVGLQAAVSPEEVDVILAGPEPILAALLEGDVRAYVDLTDLETGSHQVEVQVEILREELSVESIIPASVEVSISVAPTPTASPNAAALPNLPLTPSAAALPPNTQLDAI